jgi:RNA polymerase-binding transcription factor
MEGVRPNPNGRDRHPNWAMNAEEVDRMNRSSEDQARRRLKTELETLAARLHGETEVPRTGGMGGDFLDVAQGVERQELARLNTERLAQRARRLRIALSRVSDGQYGVCSECGEAIPRKRLLAVPDATTCVACQVRLERPRLAG